MGPRKPETKKDVIRILIVDDHPLVREGFAARIDRQADLRVCGEAEGVSDALRQLDAAAFDIVVVDISLQDGDGLDLIKRIKDRDPEAKILVQSMHDESIYGERALAAGAQGYLNKQEAPERVVEAIRAVVAGSTYLSPELTDRIVRRAAGREEQPRTAFESLSDRELEVYCLIGSGLGTSKVAARLHLSVHTIETYREKIKAKLGLEDAAALNRSAVQWVLENE